MYAVLDMDGNVVSRDGNRRMGKPVGSPQTAELAGLEPNVSYTIVAKQADNGDAPSDRMINGSQIMETGTSQQDRVYTFRLLNGGYVESVTRNGKRWMWKNIRNEVLVKAGDQIRYLGGYESCWTGI